MSIEGMSHIVYKGEGGGKRSSKQIHDTLINDFLIYIEHERGLSLRTKEAYKHDITTFYKFIDEKVYDLAEKEATWPPSYESIIEYMKHLHNQKLEVSSQARKLISIKVFMKFLFREGVIDKNIAVLLESPKLWQNIPTILGYHEVELFLCAPDLNCDEGIRDRAIIELLYGAGLRVSELCNLTIYDISDDSIRIKGKGGRERITPIGAKVLQAIDRYLLQVRNQFDSEENQNLFVTSQGKKMIREYVWKRIKFYAAQIGLTKSVSPHTFRHTYASHLLDAGADLRIIQELLGHAHIASTDRYTQLAMSQIQEVFYAFHPRWNC